jgi:hypothetical protein
MSRYIHSNSKRKKSDDILFGGDTYLEPRLMQYLEKKRYFEDNNVLPPVSLEREYDISESDYIKIRAFMRGDMKHYHDAHTDFVDPIGQVFPSTIMQKDPRFERIKEKQRRDREADTYRHNYGIMKEKYGMYDTNTASVSADLFDVRIGVNSRDDTRIKKLNEYEENRNHPISGYAKNLTYHQPTRIDRTPLRYGNNTLDLSYDNEVANIIGKVDSYQQKYARETYRPNEMLFDEKLVMPSNNSSGKRETENKYQSVPFMHISGKKDIDVESFMKFGTTPTRASKSLGYPSSFENQFSYIDDDLQLPEHTVMERGVPTRSYNKKVARPKYERDIMP